MLLFFFKESSIFLNITFNGIGFIDPFRKVLGSTAKTII